MKLASNNKMKVWSDEILADKHPLGVLIYCVAGAVKVSRNKGCNPSCELFS